MENYNDMLVSELDELLEGRGLSTSGLKVNKVHRLEKYDSEMQNAGDTPEVHEYVISEKPYKIRMWAGVKEVYVCTKCGSQYDNKDDAILHYLTHFPEKERNEVLNKLVKEF